MRFLFVDRILELIPGEVVRGIKHVTRDDHYLTCDPEGRVCFISSLIGESLGQLAAWNVMSANDFQSRPVAGVVSEACIHRPVYLGETIYLESFVDALDASAVQYHSIARVNDDVVFTLDGALGPLLPMEQFIDAALARQQFLEIYRPGEWQACSQPSIAYLSEDAHVQIVPMLFDYIADSEPGVSLSAIKYVTRAASYFPDHFPNKPVLPLTVLLEYVSNLVQEFLTRASWSRHYTVHMFSRIKMKEFVVPGDVLQAHLSVKKRDDASLVLHCSADVAGKRVCLMDIELLSV